MTKVRESATKHILEAQMKLKERFDKTHKEIDYPLDSLVLIKIPKHNKGVSRKLATRYFGPYNVTRKNSPIVYEVQSIKDPSEIRKINVRLLRPYYMRPDQIELPGQIDNTIFEGVDLVDELSEPEEDIVNTVQNTDNEPKQTKSLSDNEIWLRQKRLTQEAINPTIVKQKGQKKKVSVRNINT